MDSESLKVKKLEKFSNDMIYGPIDKKVVEELIREEDKNVRSFYFKSIALPILLSGLAWGIYIEPNLNKAVKYLGQKIENRIEYIINSHSLLVR